MGSMGLSNRNKWNHRQEKEVVDFRLSDAFLEEMLSKGYDLVQRNGQRIYAPGPDVVCPTPPKGCEVFITNIRDRSLFENDLVPLFGSIGPLYQFRLMLDFEGYCRGYAYATYFERAHACEAVNKLNGYRIRADLKLEVKRSKDNTRLFVGDVPDVITREEVMDMFSSYVYGIVDVVMMMRNKKRRNRGYVFLEFETHQLAYKGKRGLRGHKFWGKELRVEWAVPHHSATISNHKQQKATLFLTNLPVEFTATDAMKYISCLMDINMITAIRKISHYGFLDFLNRSLAENALVSLKDLVIAGRKVKVEWANSAPKRNQKNPLKALEPGQVKTDEETQIEWKLDFGGLETCLIKLFDFSWNQ